MAMSPRRYIDGHAVISTGMPGARITIDPVWRFLDKLAFRLYGVADVEAFVFADDSNSGRLLVIQFEGYVDDNEYVYDYSFAETVTLDGKLFHTDMTTIDLAETPADDSDMGRVFGLLRSEGFALPKQAMVQRFIHLPDAARRHELLILYGEPTPEDDDHAARNRMRQRARDAFTITFETT